MISLTRYRLLLGDPQLAGAFGASMAGRLPIGMAVLAILLFIQHTQQSFSAAGIAAALYVTGIGLVAPLIGRLIDRFGPRPVLLAGACTYPVALAGLMAAVKWEAGTAWIAVAALVAGIALPPIPTCMRTLLRRLLHEPTQVQAAYSLDSVLMETVFIVGPGIVSLFVAVGWPGGAVVCTAVCGGIGAVVFARTRAVRNWHAERPIDGPRPRLLAAKGLASIVAVTFLFSAGFGLFEVAVVAVATRAHVPAAAGLILALASVGSAAGALVYGSRSWSLAPTGQYKAALLAMCLGLALLAPVRDLVLFGAIAIVAGVPMATVLAAQSVLIAGIAPRAALAEAFTWASTSLLAGVSVGIGLGGLLLEVATPMLTLFGASLTTAAALATACLSVHSGRPGDGSTPERLRS
ncbi:MAG: MFS transporter [Burkholderiales bacterium]